MIRQRSCCAIAPCWHELLVSNGRVCNAACSLDPCHLAHPASALDFVVLCWRLLTLFLLLQLLVCVWSERVPPRFRSLAASLLSSKSPSPPASLPQQRHPLSHPCTEVALQLAESSTLVPLAGPHLFLCCRLALRRYELDADSSYLTVCPPLQSVLSSSARSPELHECLAASDSCPIPAWAPRLANCFEVAR